MKRLLVLIACMLPLLSAAEFVVPIESVQEYVNIRMIPDAKSEIVGRLFQGDSATLVQSIPEWHEIGIAGGATGFISSDWTNVVDELPVPELVTEVAEPAVANIDAVTNAEEPKSVETVAAAEVIAEIVVATRHRAKISFDESSSAAVSDTESVSENRKSNVELTPEQALAALADLEPVAFSNSSGLSTIDIVAVLTRVVQLQQHQIEELESRLEKRD